MQQILRARRYALEPDSVGLPSRGSRPGPRVQGLTQNEVDQLTNASSGYYSKVEAGRIPLTADYLLTLARVLRFSEDEYTYSYTQTFGAEPGLPLNPDAGRSVPPVWQRALDTQAEMAYVNDRAYNLRMHNSAFTAMFPSGHPPANTMEWMLLSDEARDFCLENWETEWGPYVMPQFRTALALHPDDPDLQRINERILHDKRALRLHEKAGLPYTHPDGDERPLRHARKGLGRATMILSQPFSSPGSRLMIVLFDPA
ncbi:helix-turn-helix domain-containing protein [Streptomyces sp. BH-SS-21]|uniref:Helix-turn-helix domain-containing protein n=1 Tax=Streptomyces liliiviolaceus TaxID=2823109 RepID=A0A940Y112_9ACTN|nr:helix-turn-helix domain-containing protein [Streptomyces liliiviolaceus]MBQ0850365.1 helix-turn-helix domain-containing protein [Streptomyces liliiviolaceus]